MTQRRTLVAVLAHPDDEVLCAGALLAQRDRGDRVVVVWLTRGELTHAFGPLPPSDVASRREALGAEAAGLLDVEHRFLDLPDGAVYPTPERALDVARVLAELAPDGLITWGDAWVKGLRHPDHQATGKIARDAVTLARIARAVEPYEAHRGPCPVFTLRDTHSQLPEVALDLARWEERVLDVAALYRREIGFGDPGWLKRRWSVAGSKWGLSSAEAYDAWETAPGAVNHLLPADPGDANLHPDRTDQEWFAGGSAEG